MDTDARLDQVEKISQNARTTWFGLLALLVFVGVTLMGHQDAHFFMRGAATQLPLVGISVPPTAFFIAAPILTAAVFCYLQVYLLGLWEVLGRIEQGSIDTSPPLSDRIYPILFTNAALWYRNRTRRDGSFRERALGRWTLTIAILVGWGFGWLILALLWWRSMPLHYERITMLAGACFWLGLFFGAHGLWAARSYLRNPTYQHVRHFSLREFGLTTSLLLALCAVSWAQTEGGLERVWGGSWAAELTGLEAPLTTEGLATFLPRARADLWEAQLTPRPPDWKPFEFWLRDHRLDRDGTPTDEDPLIPTEEEMERYRLWLARLDAPNLQQQDLSGARLIRAFAAGADFREAQMTGADLRVADLQGAHLQSANLEQANLERAMLQGANLVSAKLQSSYLEKAEFQGAVLGTADLEWTNLRYAQFQGASLSRVKLKGALLERAVFDGADLWDVKMHGAHLNLATMRGAHLRNAKMHGADLYRVSLTNADLRSAQFYGAILWQASLLDADCGRTRFTGTLAQSADLRCTSGTLKQEQLTLAVGDQYTVLPEGFWIWSCLDISAPEVAVALSEINPALDHYEVRSERSRVAGDLFCDDDERMRPIGDFASKWPFWRWWAGQLAAR